MSEADFVPAATEIRVVRGDTVQITLPVQTDDGSDADLSSYSPTALISQPNADPVTPAASIDGSSLSIAISSAQTQTLEDGSRLTATLSNADGSVVRTALYGRIFIVTKDA